MIIVLKLLFYLNWFIQQKCSPPRLHASPSIQPSEQLPLNLSQVLLMQWLQWFWQSSPNDWKHSEISHHLICIIYFYLKKRGFFFINFCRIVKKKIETNVLGQSSSSAIRHLNYNLNKIWFCRSIIIAFFPR